MQTDRLNRLLLAPLNPKQLGTAIGANTLNGRPTVLHGHFLWFRHFLFCLALHTICFCHRGRPPSAALLVKIGRILVAEQRSVKRQNRLKMPSQRGKRDDEEVGDPSGERDMVLLGQPVIEVRLPLVTAGLKRRVNQQQPTELDPVGEICRGLFLMLFHDQSSVNPSLDP
jgi:hypothetical protein